MKRLIAPVCALFVLATVAVAAEIKSGPEVGEGVAAFNVKDITGPSKGKSLCYRCQYGGAPVACVFTREITPEVASLIAQIDETVGANKSKNAKGFVVLLTDDSDGGAKQLAKLAEEKKIKNVPLTVFDGKAGPDKYNINKDAAVTVLYWNKSKVAASHAFENAKISADDTKKVVGDSSKILN